MNFENNSESWKSGRTPEEIKRHEEMADYFLNIAFIKIWKDAVEFKKQGVHEPYSDSEIPLDNLKRSLLEDVKRELVGAHRGTMGVMTSEEDVLSEYKSLLTDERLTDELEYYRRNIDGNKNYEFPSVDEVIKPGALGHEIWREKHGLR